MKLWLIVFFINFQIIEHSSFFNQAKELINKYQLDSAKSIIEKHTYDNLREEHQIMYLWSLFHLKKSHPDSAIFYAENSLNYFDKQQDSATIADIQNILGGAYYQKGDYKASLSNYLSAARYYEQHSPDQLGMIYVNLGTILSGLGRSVESINYQKAAFHYFDSTQYQFSFFNLVNLSANFRIIEQMDSAFFYIERALELSKSVNFEAGIIQANASLANLYLRVQNYDLAISMAHEVLASKPTERAKAQAFYVIASAFNEKKQPEKALMPAQKSLELVEKLGITALISSLHKLHYEIGLNRHNYESALYHFTEFHAIDDSLSAAQKLKDLNELQIQYETAKKDNEIKELNQQAAIKDLEISQKNLLLLFLGSSTLLVVGFIYLFYRQKSFKSKLFLDQLKQRLLRSQLNPHFLFNALNAIQQKILSGDDRKIAADYLARFSRMTRQVLEKNSSECITLEEEIHLMENYIELQKLRAAYPVDVAIEFDEALEIERIKIPPMLTQPIIENAFEHGLLPKKGPGVLTFKIREEKGKLYLKIRDNGVGFDLAKNQDHQSLGQRITKERLSLLEKQTRQKTHFEIKTHQGEIDNFTEVTICIPIL